VVTLFWFTRCIQLLPAMIGLPLSLKGMVPMLCSRGMASVVDNTRTRSFMEAVSPLALNVGKTDSRDVDYRDINTYIIINKITTGNILKENVRIQFIITLTLK
jgi:hypothetical protein